MFIFCVFGLPNSGKTTFSLKILDYLKKNIVENSDQCYHIEFDKYEQALSMANVNDICFEPCTWKKARNTAFRYFEDLISLSFTKLRDQYIILDDTFYLKSMRKKIIQCLKKKQKLQKKSTLSPERYSSLLKEHHFLQKLYWRWNPNDIKASFHYVKQDFRLSWEQHSYCDCSIIQSVYESSNVDHIIKTIINITCYVPPLTIISPVLTNKNRDYSINNFDKKLRLIVSDKINEILLKTSTGFMYNKVLTCLRKNILKSNLSAYI